MTDKEIIAELLEALRHYSEKEYGGYIRTDGSALVFDPKIARDAIEKHGSDHVVDTNKMIDEKPFQSSDNTGQLEKPFTWDELFNFLNKNTSPKGTWHIDFNEHRTSYHSFEQDIANYNLDPEDFVDGFDPKKDIYCLRWYRESPHGSTWLYFNTPKQALSALLGEGGEK